VQQLYTANAVPSVPDDIQLSPSAEDFRLKCFALYVLLEYQDLRTNDTCSNPDERPTASALRLHLYLEAPALWQFDGNLKH
jgi:hypothetical protein